MDHISDKGYVFHHGVVHKPVALKDAMNTSDAKSAVDKEWDTLKNLPTWSVKKVKPWSEVLQQAKKDRRSVHFASFVDLCHLKHSKLAKYLRKCKGDNVKADSADRASFTEQEAFLITNDIDNAR